jgi:hypothetical protein
MSLLKVSSVLALRSMFAKCIGPQSAEARAIPNVRSDKLSSEQFATLSNHVVEHVESFWIDPNVDGTLEELLGVEPANSDDVIFFTVGDVGFVARRNQNNRKPTETRIGPANKQGTYANTILVGRWASMIDALVYDWFGNLLSGQHRLKAALMAKRANPQLVMPLMLVTIQVPTQFRDLLDKAKARTKIDDSHCDEHLFPTDLVSLIQLRETGVVTELQSRGDERKKLIELRSKVASGIANRLNGKDVPPSGGKQSWGEEQDLADRFGVTSVPQYEQIESGQVVKTTPAIDDANALDVLCIQVLEAAKRQDGKIAMPWTEYFAPSVVAIGLALASNGEARLDDATSGLVRDSSETIEQFAERQIAIRSALLSPESDLLIDWELVKRVLHMLRTSVAGGGELGHMFESLSSSMTKDKSSSAKHLYKPMSIAAMSAFVGLVKAVRSNELETNVYTSYRLMRGTSEYSPEYRCFGGLDIGYVQTRKGKAKE